MSNVLSHAITETIHFGRKPEEGDFHIALTGTADYIPHMGVVALTVHAHNRDMPICYHFFVNHLEDVERKRLEKAAARGSPLDAWLPPAPGKASASIAAGAGGGALFMSSGSRSLATAWCSGMISTSVALATSMAATMRAMRCRLSA